MSKTPTKRGPKRAAFFANLPVTTIREIKRRVNITNPQWAVVAQAVEATKAKK
jgi:hypothetical protein